jgi:cis-3-alkyl-4-acyloxetan-2-one decarboxylase
MSSVQTASTSASSGNTVENPPQHRPHGPKEVVVPANTTWASEYPFESNWCNVGTEPNPLWMHYLDEGPKDAPVLLMLHGNPTWSFLYRNLVKAFKTRFRCIVPDHMGCGLSDRPQEWGYRLSDHADNLEKLQQHLGLSNYTLVLHDWGGMIGMATAVRSPERLTGTVVLNTSSFHGRLPKRIRTVRIPGFGRAAVLGFNAFVRAAVMSCTHHKERLNGPIRAGFIEPYGTPHDRLATLRFVEDVPLSPEHPTWDLVSSVDDQLHQFKDKPMLICWGERDWCFRPAFRHGWEKRFPQAESHPFDDAAHFVLEDAHERIVPLMQTFLNEKVLSDSGMA